MNQFRIESKDLDTFKSDCQATMSDYRRSYEAWKKSWKVGEYVVKKESSQPNIIDAVNEVSVDTCDVECMVSENTCVALSDECVVESDMVSKDACETLSIVNAYTYDDVCIVSEIGCEAASIEGVNTCGDSIIESEKECVKHVCEGFVMVSIDLGEEDQGVKGKHGKRVMGVMIFNANAFPIVVSYFQDNRPRKFLILTFDPGLDSRSNPFEE